MTDQITFELLSPARAVMSRPVAMAVVPGEMGTFGVLPGHAPMMSHIVPGIVAVHHDDPARVDEKYFVTGGFCDVVEGRCTLMADEVIPVKDMSKLAVEAELKALDGDLLSAETAEAREAVLLQMDVVRAKLLAFL